MWVTNVPQYISFLKRLNKLNQAAPQGSCTPIRYCNIIYNIYYFINLYCCLGLKFQNPNVAGEMANLIVANHEKYTPCMSLPSEQKNILKKVPFHGDQLFKERARNTIWTY